jgi:AsmA protein
MTSTPQPELPSATQSWLHRHTRLSTLLLALVILLLLFIVPPFISIRGYKKHITQLVSASLGRPARLSSVELRMLPRPGFVLTDLTVDEDPAFGAEPVLHANTVVAYIHLWSLWRGHLSLDKISVDEASLNLVRAHGRWNVDSFLHTTSPSANNQPGNQPLPYLEATDSRINIKSGPEKLPYSLTGTDASLWQDDGAWHVRLRGQPVRTDVSPNAADTGTVRLEATLHPSAGSDGAGLNQMPLHIDLDWREAQLGQLSRLILGSDEDWRGNLTGELHLDGTAAAAKITTRLRATGVHRAEFQPASPLDFDANCAFLYHAADRTLENIACDSPIGRGRVRLTGNLPASPAQPNLVLEMDSIPAQAPIDLLRTLRGNLDQGLSADGAFTGKMTYAPSEAVHPAAHSRKSTHTAPAANPLSGVFTAENVKISAEGISTPIEASKITLEPAPAEANQPVALAASVSIPAGAPTPLAVTARLTPSGFAVAVHGPAALPRLRELARMAGITQAEALSQLTGDPVALDLRIEGPWLANFSAQSSAQSSDQAAQAAPDDSAKKITGSLTLHNAAWKPDYLASPVEIPSATLRLEDGQLRWDPVAFTYGPAGTPAGGSVKGTATLSQPAVCTPAVVCTPHFTLHFAALDAAELQSALLGAKSQGTLLTTLLDRFRSTSAPNWPVLEGSIQADAFTVGRFAFTAASADLRTEASTAKITAFSARTLGGLIHGTGSLTAPSSKDNKPVYALDASFGGVNPVQAGQLVGQKWKSGTISGSGTLALRGFAAVEIVPTAKGSLHFEWRHGAVLAPAADPALAHFDRWTGDAILSDSTLKLNDNQLVRNGRKQQIEGGISLTDPPAARFAPAQKH